MLKGHVPFNRSYGRITCIRFMGIISARLGEHPFS